jgi:hypothetical protein
VLAIALMGTGFIMILLSLSPASFDGASATLKAALVSDWVSSVLTVLLLLLLLLPLLLIAPLVVVVDSCDSPVPLTTSASAEVLSKVLSLTAWSLSVAARAALAVCAAAQALRRASSERLTVGAEGASCCM